MNRWLFATIATVVLAGPARPATVAGIRVADAVRVDGATLVLNGAGKRTRYFFNVYVAALYLRARSADASRVLADPGPIRMSMTLMRHVTADELIDALREGIARNATAAELARTRPQVDALVAGMNAVGGADSGDLLTLDFLPDGTTRIGRNGAPQGRPIAGREFQRQLLSVWLGTNPVQRDLKRKLLGR